MRAASLSARLLRTFSAVEQSSSSSAAAAAATTTAASVASPAAASASASIPRPDGLPLVGTLVDFLRSGSVSNIHNYSARRHAELGPIYAERMGAVDAVFVARPDLVRDVFRREGRHPRHMIPENWLLYNRKFGTKRGLFFMDGEEWWESRQVLNKLLSHPRTVSANFDGLSKVVDRFVSDMVSVARKTPPSGEIVVDDLEPVLYHWSVSFLSVFLFGENSKRFRLDELGEETEALIASVREVFTQSAALTLIPPQLAAALNLQPWRKFVDAFECALSITRSWVERFMEAGTTSGFVGQCLAEKMEREAVLRIVIDLILAAADTTTFTTQWTLYLLSKHEHVQESVRRELMAAAAASGSAGRKNLGTPVTSPLDVDEKCLSKTPLLKGAVKEAMRLYPVAPFLTRYLPEDSRIGPCVVPKDTLILVSLYAMGRDASLFPDPLRFDPGRWVRNDGKAFCVTSYSFLPFGVGARSCVGRRLAEVNMYLLLSKLLLNYRLMPASDADVDMTMRMVGVPSEKIGLRLSPLP